MRLIRPTSFARGALVLGAVTALVLAGCSSGSRRKKEVEPPEYERTIVVASRTPHLVTYPCGEQCHVERTPDATPRELTEFHTTIEIEHGPGAEEGWCGFCHQLDDADMLRLITGETVSFDESDRVCGQCHGEKHRDWSAGIHSLDTGTWNGEATRRTCTACHDPHAPGPITFEALPPPPHVGPGAH